MNKIYWGAISTIQTKGGTEYDFPMTENQRKRVFLDKVRFCFYGLSAGLFMGIVLGYAWRMAQIG